MRKGDKLEPGSKAFLRRQDIWKHNSFLGRTKASMTAMIAILDSTTATGESKQLAGQIFGDLCRLYDSLKVRKA